MENTRQTTNSRRAKTPSDAQLMEMVGATKASEKLSKRVEDLQEFIASTHGDVEAMRWPINLIGEMKSSLGAREYDNIESLLVKWNKWLSKSETVNQSMRKIITLISAFVEDYK